MKKGKKNIISKIGAGPFAFADFDFSFDKKEENAFKDFKAKPPVYSDNVEQNMTEEIRYIREALAWIDKNSPSLEPPFIGDTQEVLYVVFESLEQRDDFLKAIDMYRIGNRYFDCHDWAEVFGIDLEQGSDFTQKLQKTENTLPDLDLNLDLDFSFDFGQPKKEEKPVVGEKLLSIREEEKNTAKYLNWAVNPNYWLAICFETQHQRLMFQKSLGIQSEKYSGYDVIWCDDFAKPFGVELLPCTFRPREWSGKQDKKLTPLIWRGETE